MGLAKKDQRKTLTETTKLNRGVAERAKQAIELTKLINRVQGCVLTKPSDPDYEDRMLTPSQVAAAKTLIERILPTTKHETIDQTVTHSYSVSHQVTDKIQALLNKAQEKVVKGVVVNDNHSQEEDETSENTQECTDIPEYTDNATYAHSLLDAECKQSLTLEPVNSV
jgi:hypothetical protein